MATHLAQRGLLAAAWARDPRKLEELGRLEVRAARSLEDLAEGCDVVQVCVTDDEALWEVCRGGLFAGLAGGGLLVVHSTVQPQTCTEVARAAGEYGIGVVDAPVCGGPSRARTGELLVSCGGEPDLVARAMPALQAIGRMVRHVGPVGYGQRVKLAMNLLYAANVEIICQAMDFAAGLGLSREAMSEFVRGLPYEGFVGGPLATGHVGAAAVLHGSRILAKDVDYAAQAAGSQQAPTGDLVSLGSRAVTSLQRLAREEPNPSA
jgi:3-hydroxyisobutyrate dehydrogenase-like beta-hydroxyacid dehydrogenase